LPVLRKDFIVDVYQVFEARAAGADALLLIAALLTDAELKNFSDAARSLGLAPLIEVHDGAELDRVLTIDAKLVGVNSRNLKDLSMNAGVFEELLPRIPKTALAVAESGIKTEDDVKKVKALGARAVLVGESLMREKDVARAAHKLVKAGQ
jgi:indole-3-glycerol phosphate synthase